LQVLPEMTLLRLSSRLPLLPKVVPEALEADQADLPSRISLLFSPVVPAQHQVI
jgi:hypothetical protein